MDQYKITDQAFFKYLKCPAWFQKDLEEGDKRHAIMSLLQEEGLLKHKRLALLGKDPSEYVEVTADDVDEGSRETLEHMKNGVQTIVGGVLAVDHFVARPDVLERVDGRSDLGDWYYVAIDFKRSSTLKEEYIYQGVFYAYVLRMIQGLRPHKGYVVHASGERSSFVIADHYQDFHTLFGRLKDIHAGAREPHFLTSGYKQSPYFEEFLREVQDCDDLSLLNRVWKKEVYALNDAGIHTVDQLSQASLGKLESVRDISMDRLYFLQQQAIAMKEGRVIVLGDLQVEKDVNGALVVDIESDPLRDVDYLFGVLEVDSHGGTRYHAFFAEREEDAEDVWRRFVTFLERVADKPMYHYGWYEVDVFRRLVERWGAPERVKEQFETRMSDVILTLRNHVIFPLSFYSLKDVAQHLGFEWRSDDASGLNSILWYEHFLEAMEAGDVAGAELWRKKIEEYNEDDVRATWFMKLWALRYGTK